VNDEKTNALTDLAYYHGARHAMAALAAGMSSEALHAEMLARVAPARKWMADNRGTLRSQSTSTGESHG